MFELDSVFSMYANREQNIENFIKLLAADSYREDSGRQRQLAERCGIPLSTLTAAEIQYIEKEVFKRC